MIFDDYPRGQDRQFRFRSNNHNYFLPFLNEQVKPVSVKTSSVEMRTATADHVNAAAFVAHVACSCRSRIGVVICN